MLKKHNRYNINAKDANEALQNVFAACEIEPNNTPLEVIRVWSFANVAIVRTGLWVSLILLVIVLAMPFAFVRSGATEKNRDNSIRVVSHYYDSDSKEFVMVLDDGELDYKGIYAKNEKGDVIFPTYVDESAHTVKIPFEKGNINIFIPKMDGTMTQAVLSR